MVRKKRKSRSFGDLGYTAAVHKERAAREVRFLKGQYRLVRRNIKAGKCGAAIRSFKHAVWMASAAAAHRASAGKSVYRIGSASAVINQLSSRLVKACARGT